MFMADVQLKTPPVPPSKTRFSRPLVGLMIAVIAIALAWTQRAPILQTVAGWWIVSDELAHADAAVVLGGDLDVRSFAAAALYKRGFADTVLVSNVRKGKAERLGFIPTLTELTHDILTKLEVPATAIEDFGEELYTTQQEAQAVRAWATQAKAKSIIIPTELFSARRVHWIFDRELAPIGVHVIVHAYQSEDYTIADWWYRRRGLIDFNNEVLKYLYYRAKY